MQLPERAHHKSWPPRLPKAITPPATSLWDNLETSARRYPGKAALVFLGGVFTYAQVRQLAERLAARLHALGVAQGDRVLLVMQNCPQLVIAHFAILRANAVVVPVNPMNRADELQHYIADAGARVAITTADLAAELAQASNQLPPGQGLKHLVASHFTDAFDAEAPDTGPVPPAWSGWLLARHLPPELEGGTVTGWNAALDNNLALPELVAGPEDLAVLPYTSGTTGLPKGCMHPHRSVMHNAVATAAWGNATCENVALVAVPMFHATGMVSVMHACIFSGSTLVLMPRWDRELAGWLVTRWQVTQWTNIPTMVIDLLGSPDPGRCDLSSLVHIGGGGAAMPQAVAERLQDQFGLQYVEGYGLTETAAPSHCNPVHAPKQQCLGIPFMSCDSRVVDPVTLQELPPGEQGEIVIRGPMVFNGYWRQPEATAAAFIELGGERYFRSGDLGYVDADGYFFLTDRLKRMINASGFKVWPAEVEALMFRHPAIQEACVIAAKDAYRGETVKAVVVLRASHQGRVGEQDIIDWCRGHMAAYKVPRVVQFAAGLPRSGSGKVMWRALQEAENRAAP